jgi:hypothetical protein
MTSIVVQVGKWRRVTTVNVTSGCTDIGDFRLPSKSSEGDMPQIAVTTGGADSLECLLELMGIDPSEFVPGPGGAGHIHMFNGLLGNGVTGSPEASTLWNDAKTLSPYDIVLLSCEGEEANDTKTNKQAMHDYLEAGGRVFASHFQYTWFKNGPNDDFKSVADWGGMPTAPSGITYLVVQDFPKGKAFAEWLFNVQASPKLGEIPLVDVRESLSTVNTKTSQAWLGDGPGNVKYFSFNAPIAAAAANQCGRAVFSDLHVSAFGSVPFGACRTEIGGDLSPQQKALEFMLFDLSACLQSDGQTPTPPR